MSAYHGIQNETDKAVADQSDVQKFLEAANEKLAEESFTRQTKLFGDMVISGSEKMKLRYNLND